MRLIDADALINNIPSEEIIAKMAVALAPTIEPKQGDTIYRQAAIDALIEWYGCKPDDIEAFEEIIKAIPTADRPQGRNLSEEYPSLFECSVCGASCFDTIPWDCDINYCPNCGARMKGGTDGNK